MPLNNGLETVGILALRGFTVAPFLREPVAAGRKRGIDLREVVNLGMPGHTRVFVFCRTHGSRLLSGITKQKPQLHRVVDARFSQSALHELSERGPVANFESGQKLHYRSNPAFGAPMILFDPVVQI